METKKEGSLMTFDIAFYSLLIGIVGSVLAKYIPPPIEKLLSNQFKKLRGRFIAKKELRTRLIEEIASDGTLLQLAAMRSYFIDMFFMLAFIAYLALPPLSLANMVGSLGFGFMAMAAAYKGGKLRKLVNEAKKQYQKNLQESKQANTNLQS